MYSTAERSVLQQLGHTLTNAPPPKRHARRMGFRPPQLTARMQACTTRANYPPRRHRCRACNAEIYHSRTDILGPFSSRMHAHAFIVLCSRPVLFTKVSGKIVHFLIAQRDPKFIRQPALSGRHGYDTVSRANEENRVKMISVICKYNTDNSTSTRWHKSR